ncbi:hypothetical protein A9P44_03550 [Paenibacillus polymyxa]|nr:tyrosine-type recombinase/integrase [Paenibacillus polymyxa]OBA06006.1 hypothetical protein A9P44_03550 [Paenibacillus polymyxa]
MHKLERVHTLQETPNEKISFNNKSYGFKTEDVPTYEGIYQKLKNQNIVKSGEFFETTWIMYNHPGQSKEFVTFKFDLELHKEFNLALKCYIVQLINTGHSLSYLKSLQINIRQAFLDSLGFKPSFRKQYEDLLMVTSHRKKEQLIVSNLMFADFYSNHWNRDYERMFRSISLPERRIRTLPNYESIIKFDDILLGFMSNCDSYEKKKYMPVLLWWRITKIIPLRPAEFLSIKANCLSSHDGKFTITIPREKQKGNGDIEITNTLQITKEIYDLIDEYLLLQSEIEKSEYLLAYMPYNLFIPKPIRKAAKNKRNRTDKMDNSQMQELLHDFYEEVVGKKFGYPNIERVRLGDTRHFAFCNMMLQGYNALTIARIGGHLHLKSQLSYSRHLDYFAEARVRILSETIKRNRDQNLGDTILSSTNGLIIKSKIRKGEISSIAIQGGFCKDNSFPINCIDDCIFCTHFQLDLTNKSDVIDSLKLKSSKFSQNIRAQIETMQRFSAEMLYDKATMQYSHEDQERLFILATKLREMLNKKAIVDSYIPE